MRISSEQPNTIDTNSAIDKSANQDSDNSASAPTIDKPATSSNSSQPAQLQSDSSQLQARYGIENAVKQARLNKQPVNISLNDSLFSSGSKIGLKQRVAGNASNSAAVKGAAGTDAIQNGLSAGQSTTVTITSSNPNNYTGVMLEEGGKYKMEVVSETDWRDAYIDTDANGFSKWYMKLFEPFRGVPKANWFALIGKVAEQGSPFVIGKGNTITATKTGELISFANDVSGFYKNNHGSLQLKITRLE